MRRTNKAAAEDEAQIDLTPMLDVVFIMLIFFIVTASFIKESGIEVNRPEASTSQPKENVNILVAISATNEIWMDQRRIDVVDARPDLLQLSLRRVSHGCDSTVPRAVRYPVAQPVDSCFGSAGDPR